jgi:hypothetical protein
VVFVPELCSTAIQLQIAIAITIRCTGSNPRIVYGILHQSGGIDGNGLGIEIEALFVTHCPGVAMLSHAWLCTKHSQTQQQGY